MTNKMAKFLKKHRIFNNKQANAAGISNRIITYYKKKGLFHQYSKGIYISNFDEGPQIDPEIEELAAILNRIPEGVVCMVTALYYYGLTEEIPRKFWISIPHDMWAPKIKKRSHH